MLFAGETWGVENGRITWAVLLSGFAGVTVTLLIAGWVAWLTIRHERRLARDERLRTMLAQMVTRMMNTDGRWQTYAEVLNDLAAAIVVIRMSLQGEAPDVYPWAMAALEADRESLAGALLQLRPDEVGGLAHVSAPFRYPALVGVLLQWGETSFPAWRTADLDRRLTEEGPSEHIVRR